VAKIVLGDPVAAPIIGVGPFEKKSGKSEVIWANLKNIWANLTMKTYFLEITLILREKKGEIR